MTEDCNGLPEASLFFFLLLVFKMIFSRKFTASLIPTSSLEDVINLQKGCDHCMFSKQHKDGGRDNSQPQKEGEKRGKKREKREDEREVVPVGKFVLFTEIIQLFHVMS